MFNNRRRKAIYAPITRKDRQAYSQSSSHKQPQQAQNAPEIAQKRP